MWTASPLVADVAGVLFTNRLWITLIATLLIYWFAWSRSRFVRLINRLPGPRGIPLLGNALQIGKTPDGT